MVGLVCRVGDVGWYGGRGVDVEEGGGGGVVLLVGERDGMVSCDEKYLGKAAAGTAAAAAVVVVGIASKDEGLGICIGDVDGRWVEEGVVDIVASTPWILDDKLPLSHAGVLLFEFGTRDSQIDILDLVSRRRILKMMMKKMTKEKFSLFFHD